MSETTDSIISQLTAALRIWVKGVEIVNTPSDARVTIIVSDYAEARILSNHIAKYVMSHWTDVLDNANAEKNRATGRLKILRANSLAVMADIEKSEKQTSEDASDKPKEAKPEEEECF